MLSNNDSPEVEKGTNFSISQGENFGRRKNDQPALFDIAPNGVTVPQEPTQFQQEMNLHGYGLTKQQREQLLADFVLHARNGGQQ